MNDDDADTEGLDALRTRIRQRIKDMQQSRGYNKDKDDMGNKTKARNNNDDKNGQKHANGQNNNNSNSNSKSRLTKTTKSQKTGSNSSNGVTKSHQSKGLMEDLMLSRDESSEVTDNKKATPTTTTTTINADIDFGNIAKLQGSSKDKSIGKPGSKMKRLKRMLEEATTKRQRIETLKSGNELDVKRAKEEQWTDVLKIAAGESVVLDAKNIKKAIKKREKMKEKSAETWKGRLEKLETAKDEKMQKREDNIAKKLGKEKAEKEPEAGTGTGAGAGAGEKRKRLGGPDGKYSAAKKSADAAASESPSRPGFEGKKGGFLNKKGKK
jgi:hypothetical protein